MALLVLLASTGGCTHVSPTSEPTTSPTGPPGTLDVHLISDAPVIEGPSLDGKSYALPGAYAIVDGTHHAWVIGFGQARGDQRVFHVTSTDGLTWTIDTADPTGEIGLGLELVPPGPIPTSVLVETDGSWTMYLWGTTSSTGLWGGSIWRATATAAEGPWVVDPVPVLAPSEDAWDSHGVDFASVLRTADGYVMAYSGSSREDRNTGHLGWATSTDGIAWTKQTEPIVSPGLCGDRDDRTLSQSRLIADGTGEGYLLLYSGNGMEHDDAAIDAAASPDGETWTCASPSPLLDRPDVPGSQGIHTIALAEGMGRPQLLVESLVDGASELWLAELTVP